MYDNTIKIVSIAQALVRKNGKELRMTATVNRFGNMMPSEECVEHPYLLDRHPFHVAGNVYYVGNHWCSSHLIDTGEGLILLDTPCASGLPGLMYNIEELGFRVKDVRYIIVSHAHSDHFGAVTALVHKTKAKTFLGEIDAEDMVVRREQMEQMNRNLGAYNECFTPDVTLRDGDIIELGNTRIRCVLTPGHTIGVMSHFWQTEEDGQTLNVGIYGGAGFVSLSEAALKENGLPLEMQNIFTASIDKVWNEKVDVMLGNHPFHNDTYQKAKARKQGEKNPFIDPGEWHRFLTELKVRYQEFLRLKPEEVVEMYSRSYLADYYADCL